MIRRQVPLCPPELGPVVKSDSYPPCFFNELSGNRIPKGMPSGIPGKKEAWVSFSREQRKVGVVGGKASGGFLKTLLLTHET